MSDDIGMTNYGSTPLILKRVSCKDDVLKMHCHHGFESQQPENYIIELKIIRAGGYEKGEEH